MVKGSEVIRQAALALRERASRSQLVQRVSDRFALPQLYERYKKNLLTHGYNYLKGEDEILFVGEQSPAPLAWRSIPSEGAHSLSRATVTSSDMGHVVLKGYYCGVHSELQMIPGVVPDETTTSTLAPGACGMASTGHWQLDLSQHHWLELKLRTDRRLYELVIQYDGYFEGVHHLYRCLLPRGPPPRPEAVSGGAYAVLGVDADADAETLQRAYKRLAMELHPDRGGDEEKFKLVSKAFALLSDPQRREHYDRVGPDDEEPALTSLGDWRTLKVPFTAFKDRSFYTFSEKIATIYLLLRDENAGPFALELAELKAGRCKSATLASANFAGSLACESGFCECGYYNGLRVEPFNGPLQKCEDGSFPSGSIEYGFAEHHVDDQTR